MRTHLRSSDDRGSLPMAMLVIAAGMALSVALLPLVIRQVTSVRLAADRNTALAGARIGLDVVMARIAAASIAVAGEEDPVGLLEDLPGCTVKGDVGVGKEKLEYQVKVEYFREDGTLLTCPLKEAPKTAKLTSKGLGAVDVSAPDSTTAQYASRTLDATYTFKLDNDNKQTTGGAIRVSSSTVGNLCMDSTSKTPAAGTVLRMRICDGSSTQQFQYTKELYVKLVNSETATAPEGMCLWSATPRVNGNPIVFQPCPTGAINTQYQWSLDGSSVMHSTSATQSVESFCINLKTASTIGTNVQLGACGANGATNVWRFDAAVGAGMAGEETYQLVNYSQFSRCLDVTNKDTGYKYMIAWFCKQDPKGAVEWNQIWVAQYPVAPAVEKKGAIVVTKSGVKYCLKSPLPTKPAVDSWVTTAQCPATYLNVDSLLKSNPELVWNVRRDTGSYTTSYRIEDTKGYCLQPTDLKTATTAELHSDGTSRIKIATCSSSELQKWNAPANITNSSPISDIVEK